MTLRDERLNAARRQCSGIFLLTRNITTGVPGNYKNQLKESLTKLRNIPLDEQNKDILRSCRRQLIESGQEKSLCDMIENVYGGSMSQPNLF